MCLAVHAAVNRIRVSRDPTRYRTLRKNSNDINTKRMIANRRRQRRKKQRRQERTRAHMSGNRRSHQVPSKNHLRNDSLRRKMTKMHHSNIRTCHFVLVSTVVLKRFTAIILLSEAVVCINMYGFLNNVYNSVA